MICLIKTDSTLFDKRFYSRLDTDHRNADMPIGISMVNWLDVNCG
jgi:hypothetical protein